ncbi:MAG: cytochrome-c peroxidase [Saprospiraceae bacterium]
MMSKYSIFYFLGCCICGSLLLISIQFISCEKQIETVEVLTDFSGKRNRLTAQEWRNTGQLLFESRSLSPKKVSCQSCHAPKTYFQDGYEVAIVYNKKLTRNTPTLLNVNRYTSFFWDGRVNSIRKQLEGPLFSRAEMESNPALLYQVITTDSLFEKAVKQVGVTDKSQAVEFVMYALEQYLFSITTKRTKFHDFLNGEQTLSKQEAAGYEIFLNKAKCGRCHPAPDFTDNKYHDIGLPRRKTIFESYKEKGKVRYRLGSDFGRGNIVIGSENLFAFRTPSLINAVLTAPYMHDGAFNELEEVIDFYARRDSVLLQAPLSSTEKKQLLAFLKTLNDEKYTLNNEN